jgi:transcriptional regulator with XRE-family HTH domain
MTGNDIKAIRTQLALTPVQLADLIGASQSTVYRWEQTGPNPVAVDPGQLRLLNVMRQQIDAKKSGDLATGIAAGLLVGGGLLGLYYLLDAVYADQSKSKARPRPRRTSKSRGKRASWRAGTRRTEKGGMRRSLVGVQSSTKRSPWK